MAEQTPATQPASTRKSRIGRILIGGTVLAFCAICFVAVFYLGSGTTTWDVSIGTELDQDGHVLQMPRAISQDTPEVYLGFNFYSLTGSAVDLQICWFYEKQLLDCDQGSYEDGYVVTSLPRNKASFFPAGHYWVLVYDLLIVEDHVMVGESFDVK